MLIAIDLSSVLVQLEDDTLKRILSFTNSLLISLSFHHTSTLYEILPWGVPFGIVPGSSFATPESQSLPYFVMIPSSVLPFWLTNEDGYRSVDKFKGASPSLD